MDRRRFTKYEIFRAWPKDDPATGAADAEFVYYLKCLELLGLLSLGRDRCGAEHFVRCCVCSRGVVRIGRGV